MNSPWHQRGGSKAPALVIVGGLILLLVLGIGWQVSQSAYADAIARLSDATLRLSEVRRDAARLAGAHARNEDATPPVRIAAALSRAGLTAEVRPRGDAYMVSIAAARGPVLIGWLRDVESNGIVTVSASLRRNSDATVAGEFRFAGATR